LIVHLGGEAVATPADRILAWAARRRQRVFGHNPWQLGAHVLRTALRHRVTGPAAEMSFFAMLTLVPLTVAVGAVLGQIQRFVGPEKIARGQDAAISLVRVVISPELTDGVVDPFVRAQLDQRKGGTAIGGLLLTWWLAGRLFAATSRALDTAYHDRHQRLSMHQRLIALGFAFGSVLVVVLTLGIMVDAPFLDEQRDLALEFGVSQALVTAWYILRWPVVLAVLVAFLLCLYRFAPSVRHAWRHLLPGAVLGVALWILAAVAFRVYLALGGDPTGVVVNDAKVVIIGQAVGAVVATVLWTYFSSVAILVGNELNAELARLRQIGDAGQ
jgi:membrane protein